jgi:signal transduction histidine kinase
MTTIAAEKPQARHMDTGRILLVDDNPTNIDVLYDFLSEKGYEVFVAEDGPSAISRLNFITPDLILLDIMMPHMNGYEVCEHVKSNETTRDVPIIFITAMGATDDKVRGFEVGGVDYITKPFQNQEVLVRIRTHLALRNMRRKLVSKNELLTEQNEALDAYARTVAHDLKNPLNLILNFARLIQDENELNEVATRDLGTIIQSADRMNHIIQDLLLLAQLRKDEVFVVDVNMESVVQQSLARLYMQIEKAGATIEEPQTWVSSKGVASWVQAIWVNFISNALKYGGSPPSIQLLCEKRDGMVFYGVQDNGPGVPEEMKDAIFEEFSRVGGEKEEGHGIGLSIVKRIASRLDGEVGMYNLDSGTGCCFYFLLPVDRKDQP